jgi:hypothetical protein
VKIEKILNNKGMLAPSAWRMRFLRQNEKTWHLWGQETKLRKKVKKDDNKFEQKLNE